MKILIVDFTIDREFGLSFKRSLNDLGLKLDQILVIRPEDTQANWKPDGIILSGSSTRIDLEPPWYEVSKQFTLKAIESKTPLLGVCYGAQFIAKILNANTGATKKPEFGSTKIIKTFDQSWLLRDLQSFVVYNSHYDEIKSPLKFNHELSTITAKSARCPIQAFEFENYPIAGVQFHPEKNQSECEKLLNKNHNSEYIYKEGKIMDSQKNKIFKNFINRILV